MQRPLGSLVRFVTQPPIQLVGISAVSLFLELGMIRYVNSTVQIVAYFNNILVLSAFLGLGLGSLLTGRSQRIFTWMPFIFAVVIDLMAFLSGFGIGANDQELVTWTVSSADRTNLPIPLVILAVFSTNLLFFVPLGYRLGQCLELFENRLLAYSWDLAGSILGVALFALASALQTPPWVWFLCAAIMLLGWIWVAVPAQRQWRRFGLYAAFMLLGVGFTFLTPRGTWSPYYKVTTRNYPAVEEANGKVTPLGFQILVDRLRIQDALNFTPVLEQTPLRGWFGYYQLPYLFGAPKRVLILGGGSGNDTVFALRNHAEHVDVVEIDPVIADLGRTRHPNQPYTDPRVRVIVDDARAFLRRNHEPYDLVVMNALDSHLQLPGLSTLRLESYVYTREAFEDVQQSLAPGALFIVHLASSRPWMGLRLYWSLAAAFDGREPSVFSTVASPYQSMAFVYGPSNRVSHATSPDLVRVTPDAFRAARNHTVIATDDWPQLYLSGKTIPRPYIIVLLGLLVVVWVMFRVAGRADVRGNLSLFLLGSAFMLLETRSVTKTALLFGSTWFVNAIVIAAILVVVAVANVCVLWGRRPSLRVAFPLLCLVLVVQTFTPEDWMLGATLPLRLALVTLWIGAPILLAGFIFPQLFQRAQRPAQAFGANLVGAALGGALEYLSMVYGLSSLFLIAAALYVLAALASGEFSGRRIGSKSNLPVLTHS